MKNYFLTLTLLFFLLKTNAQEGNLNLGLTLSGGGAKGLAHIGVLKVLEEEGITPHFISGTSMGSIVGGLYSIGYTADDLEKLTREIDWLEYFNDDVPRSFQPIEEKNVSERYQFSFPFAKGQIQIPKGYVNGAKMSMLLSQLTLPVHDIKNFDDFVIPFRALATDLETGEGYVFSDGFLADAMRASACIPTVFDPFEINGKTLVDGMFVRNLPVEDVQRMGAQLVIAVDVGAPLATKEELNSFVGVLGQTTSFGMVRSTEEQQQKANILIKPELNDIGALDFSNVDTIIARGERAARKALPQIRELRKQILLTSKSPTQKQASLYIPDTLTITSIKFEGDEKTSEPALLRLLKIKPPQILTQEKLNNKLMGMYASGFFTFVDYKLLPDLEGYQLLVRTKASENIFVKGSGFYDSNVNAAILLNGTFRNKLIKGSQLTVDLRVSETPGVFLDYLIHTNTRPNVGLRIDGKWNFFLGEYYENNRRANEFQMQHAKDQIGFYSGISTHSSVWLGWGTEVFVQKQVFSVDRSENVNLTQNYFFLDFARDKLNRENFPTRGNKIRLNGKYVAGGKLRNRVDQIDDKSTSGNYYATFDYKNIFPVGKKNNFSIHWKNQAGYAYLNESNFINLFYIGNDLSQQNQHIDFVGLDYMEQLANRYAISGLKFQWEPASLYFVSAMVDFGYFELDEYTLVQEGEVFTKNSAKKSMLGTGIELGMLFRQFGPMSFISEYNLDTDRFNFFLRLGYAF